MPKRSKSRKARKRSKSKRSKGARLRKRKSSKRKSPTRKRSRRVARKKSMRKSRKRKKSMRKSRKRKKSMRKSRKRKKSMRKSRKRKKSMRKSRKRKSRKRKSRKRKSRKRKSRRSVKMGLDIPGSYSPHEEKQLPQMEEKKVRAPYEDFNYPRYRPYDDPRDYLEKWANFYLANPDAFFPSNYIKWNRVYGIYRNRGVISAEEANELENVIKQAYRDELRNLLYAPEEHKTIDYYIRKINDKLREAGLGDLREYRPGYGDTLDVLLRELLEANKFETMLKKATGR